MNVSFKSTQLPCLGKVRAPPELGVFSTLAGEGEQVHLCACTLEAEGVGERNTEYQELSVHKEIKREYFQSN